MTLISKVETLIEYAKYGVSMSHAHNGDGEYELYLPRSLGSYTAMSRDGNIINVVSGIKGKIFSFGSNNNDYPMFRQPNSLCRIIDLPECIITPGSYGIFSNLKVLKVFRMPKLKTLKNAFFDGDVELETVEVGALDSTSSTSFSGCENLKELVVGNGTRANLYLYHCPNLSKECLESIIDNYADMTGTKAPTFYVGEENLAKISPEYLKKLESKNVIYQ